MILFQLKSSYQSHCVVSKMCHFVMSEKVGPKYEEVLLEMLDSKEVHEMLDFCFLFPTLDQHFSVQAGRLTSLGSVLHEDGPLG